MEHPSDLKFEEREGKGMLKVSLLILFSYLVGSIPTGYLVGRLKGVDLRMLGSGNVGATNVARILGIRAAIFILFFDMAKGAMVIYLVSLLANWQFFSFSPERIEFLRVSVGLAAICGHIFTPFLEFRGGKGVATLTGVLIGLAPMPMIIILPVFLTIVILTRFVSVGSIVGALLLPILMCILKQGPIITLFGGIAGILIIIRHIPNIRRLLSNTEYRFGERINP